MASKFNGLKVLWPQSLSDCHPVVTQAGKPVEVLLVPGATPDVAALRAMDLNLPAGSTLIGDGGFLDRAFEAALRQEAGLRLLVLRRNVARPCKTNLRVMAPSGCFQIKARDAVAVVGVNEDTQTQQVHRP